MLRGNSNCCGGGDSCHREPNCKTPSSSIYYDGENIEEAGLYHGMPLNTALANLAGYVSKSVKLSGSVKKENFSGISKVRLSSDPEEILMVTYCGFVVPAEGYKTNGRNLLFCQDLCFEDEFAPVQVIYREKANLSYGFGC